ncbi:SDR family NAD(P)-dependent oxidoreductase [Martelella mediterranea]|uniref:SDR family NAD(P)-dependent oxidoreductase n=1 Tax=Martelella mediterranea TaxID=293089 RepID=UPI001E4E8EAD|nr:SDR family NAD(P)-dependent oxidoreductase [Martelella mediterranea]MCD1635715.1 SDR family NAD(P)-dependent oxidoreductase [Martelella mediterranea]
MDLHIEGRTALVTGSSKGIGAGIARGLALEGATVIVHGRDVNQARGVAEQIEAEGGMAHVVTGDLTDAAQVEAMVSAARAAAGDIDILVNNAGGSGGASDWSTTEAASWAATYDANVLAAVRVTSAVLPAMRRARWGRIINIASLAGLMPPAANPDYSAAKAAMLAMSASMAKAVAAEGVTVNTVSPGTIHSGKLDFRFREVAQAKGIAPDASWDEVEAAVLSLFAAVPVGRVGTLEEIADAVCFLASPRAAYITGSNLRLDGGMLPAI